MKQATQPPPPADNLTKHLRAEIQPQRTALESQKKAIEEQIRQLPAAVGDETIMYAQAAGLTSLDDVIWRIKAGLTAKQAVEIAAQQMFEAKVEDFRKSVEQKSDAEILEMAEEAGVVLPQKGNGELSRSQLLIGILKRKQ